MGQLHASSFIGNREILCLDRSNPLKPTHVEFSIACYAVVGGGAHVGRLAAQYVQLNNPLSQTEFVEFVCPRLYISIQIQRRNIN
jgi:hypothetical protein